MQGHSIKYARGTVWLCRDDVSDSNIRPGFKVTNTHVQKKTRPVLIVSNNIGNTNSPVLNVVPLTTQDKRSGVAVALYKEDGILCCILCNQIKTIDKSQLIQYEFTVDDETMAEVEKTIQHALGIKCQTIDKSLKDIENIVSNIVKMKFNDLSTRQEFDTTIDHVVKGLESTYSQLMIDYIGNINDSEKRLKESSKMLSTIIENKAKSNSNSVSNKSETDNNIETNNNKKCRKNKSRGFWTTEIKRQFLKDYEEHSTAYMLETYGFDTEKQLKKRWYNYRWELKSAGLLND